MLHALQGVSTRLALMALDAYSLRHQVIAHNIANADSESFHPLRVNFEQQLTALQSAFASGAPDADLVALADSVSPFVEEAPASKFGGDGALRLDDQMAQLAQNTLQYEALLSALGKQGALLRIAVLGDIR